MRRYIHTEKDKKEENINRMKNNVKYERENLQVHHLKTKQSNI